ncbi:MAG: hypothetical protein FWF83_01650 [Clostridiales bacterium]|nr:hypothetical protein [Clostridiales bacterium]
MIEPIISGEGRISPYDRYRQYQFTVRPGKTDGLDSPWGANGQIASPERVRVSEKAALPDAVVTTKQILKPGQSGQAAEATAASQPTSPGQPTGPRSAFMPVGNPGTGRIAPAEGKECQTCKSRKYQDRSDDPGVSYQTPTSIRPEKAASAVRAHENEHVSREQAKASRTGREVVSQSVVLKTAICPECGRVYISGGTTTTVTRAKDKGSIFQAGNTQDNDGLFLDKSV